MMEDDCDVCEHGADAVLPNQKECMAKYGWYVHYVNGDDSCPHGVNYHTHGFEESYNHPDCQIVIPLHPKVAHSLFVKVHEAIKAGRIFEEGVKYGQIVTGYDVVFVPFMEGNRIVHRMILPDEKGNLTSDVELFAKQWD